MQTKQKAGKNGKGKFQNFGERKESRISFKNEFFAYRKSYIHSTSVCQLDVNAALVPGENKASMKIEKKIKANIIL